MNRIDQNTFDYREFEDGAADGEVWPMFEALLLDEGMVGSREAHRRRENAIATTRKTARTAAGIGTGSTARGVNFASHVDSAFSTYTGEATLDRSRPGSKASVKSLLERLAGTD